MTTQTLSELERFHRFVGEKLNNGAAGLTVEQVLVLWRERRENVKAIQEALDEMEAGDTGVPFEDVIDELRQSIRDAREK